MSLSPLISVVTVSFNAREGLAETINSVRAQNSPDVEHVIVDGDSTDGTLQLLESSDANIRWVSEPDEGIADALNKGFLLAQGEWVIVLGAEDTLYTADAIDLMRRAISDPLSGSFDVLAFDVMSVRDGVETRLRSGDASRRLRFKPLHHQGVLCRRGLFDAVGGFSNEFKVCMDYEWLLRAKRRGARFFAIPEVVSRMPATGVSSRLDWPSLSQRFNEERRIQLRHSPNAVTTVGYQAYWRAYLNYRRIKHLLS